MGAMFDFCKAMYGMPGFDLRAYVEMGDVVLTKDDYKSITGMDYDQPSQSQSQVSASNSTTESQSISSSELTSQAMAQLKHSRQRNKQYVINATDTL